MSTTGPCVPDSVGPTPCEAGGGCRCEFVSPMPESLRTWIEKNAEIPVGRQILMTAKGKNVKQQHLLSEGEIFVYDKALLTGDLDDISVPLQQPETTEFREFPSTLDDEESLRAWQDLFAARRAWALEIVDIVKSGVSAVDDVADQCEVFEKCTQVAIENLQNHFLSLQQTADRTQSWAIDTLTDHDQVLGHWKEGAQKLSELSVREDVVRLLSLSWPVQTDAAGTMLGLLDMKELENSSTHLTTASKHFQGEMSELSAAVTRLSQEIDKVASLGAVAWPALDTNGIVAEIEAMATKASRDYEEVLKAADTAKSIATISRSAARHTQELLPAMAEIASDIRQMMKNGSGHRTTIVNNMKQALKQISKIQSQFVGMHTRVSGLEVTEQGQTSLETLDKVFRLPVVYGSVLIESVRRSEWHVSVRNDLDSLHEELSQQKNDELRRRKKWATTLGVFINAEAMIGDTNMDLNLSTPANVWPVVTRQEITTYVDDVRALGIVDATEQIGLLFKELEAAGRQRKSKTKAFKNGSIYDMGQSFLRNGDEVRTLQDDKLRLEDKIRASKSQIRKLEDLLHRQSQLSRPASGIFTPQTDFERQLSSPGPSFGRPADSQSRRPSMSLRRLSNQNLDEKAMVQKIFSLESQVSKLQDEIQAERRAGIESREKMQEAESVKRDLMANFEAQRQEFDDERQLLDDDNHKLKVRLEEVEDELDRVLGSRDHQRMTHDQTITGLRNDLDRANRGAEAEIKQINLSKTKLQNELNEQRDRVSSLEKLYHQLREERSSLQTQNVSIADQLRATKEKEQETLERLRAAFVHLSPSEVVPETLDSLAEAMASIAEGAAARSRQQHDDLQRATAESKAQQNRVAILEAQVQESASRLAETRTASKKAEDLIAEERSRLDAVRSELLNEQTELERLREKFAAGETGSDALKSRLAEEEKRVVELMEANAKQDAQIRGLRHEIETFAQNNKDTQAIEESRQTHLNARGLKARELSERLFQYNDRLVRLVENFGYLITKQNETLLLQRASKVNASTILNTEGSSPSRRTVSGSIVLQHFAELADLDSLYWVTENDAVAEDISYDAFAKAMSRLDLDNVMETITKRYKDVEALAKKYQKDSRANRDRCHRLQGEAHEKIAYRSFKEGDLALFLPTRNQAARPWAAFNVGAPHYFLREQDAHKLQTRDWLLARITKVEERVVDLSRSLASTRDRASIQVEGSDGGSLRSLDDENPFELSDGLRWYMIDAAEEKPGAPSTPGLGKSTAAASVVEVKGHMSRKSLTGREASEHHAVNVAKTLSKSLDSRRSSDTSRKSGTAVATLRAQGSGNSGIQAAASAAASNTTLGTGTNGAAEGRMTTPTVRPSDEDVRRASQGPAREDAGVFDVGDLSAPGSNRRPQTKIHTGSPMRRMQGQGSQTSSPVKRSWDKLFSLEYRG